ncbi:L-piperidine-6-carboxylate dehydrogenase [Acanthopleuribacter pedis]|uniref:aldehyde dehydrogenase (NAD(+)) n=1 Tax=Acanthopleuribacter pedis TaxID=442870 RepID=A0A8J7Q9V6_9BACT|nr:aldehyde dehydrogenase family protein [Acanthopleuribacter pedis]MBO1320109.1 aldehyde dehydrogenase family protein [Acanthopleuribacter pedis]
MHDFLKRLGIKEVNSGVFSDKWLEGKGGEVTSYSPANGEAIAKVTLATKEEYEEVMAAAQESFKKWRTVPAPIRGQVVRELGEVLRAHKDDLGRLVTLEMGKIHQEGLGEVQEIIDIIDYAVGLSRQLYGFTMHSERPGHRMYDQYHPLGVVGVITAFNFPAAVFGWNAMIAAVCGDSVVWKPSLKTPLVAVAMQNLFAPVLAKHGFPGLFTLCTGEDLVIGETLVNDHRIPLVSATGSVRMGKIVGAKVAGRLGRSILELGGNNAIILTPSADLNIAIPGIVFGAVGTAGQRCTTTRRLICHESLVDQVVEKLVNAYGQVRIGDPLDADTLMGPLIDEDAVQQMQAALEKVRQEGGEVLCGGERVDRPGFYVTPAIAKAKNEFDIVQNETFAPILYVIPYSNLDEAIGYQNGVPQGLSSAIFTNEMREGETFLSHVGSDCGIANVNIGTSGAEIGGAFGGEKETGGGRESGSDSWKAYMRRQTNTINYSSELPLAQGITFEF